MASFLTLCAFDRLLPEEITPRECWTRVRNWFKPRCKKIVNGEDIKFGKSLTSLCNFKLGKVDNGVIYLILRGADNF